jgi:hypothetical protein
MVSKLLEIWSGLFISDPDPDFLPIPDQQLYQSLLRVWRPLHLPETSAGANSPVLDWLLRHPGHVFLLAVRPVLALPITLLNLLKGLCHERINFFEGLRLYRQYSTDLISKTFKKWLISWHCPFSIPVLRIRDVYPGSEFFPSRVPDSNLIHTGSRIRLKEFEYFNPPKNGF